MEELGGDKGPCRASDQDAGHQGQTGRLDLDHGEENRPEWDKHVYLIQSSCLEATS